MKKVLHAAFLVASTLTIAARAHAACDWDKEIFKSHIDEKCQAEFEGKLTDEQDKIFSRRMFKDWNLPADTQVRADNGYLEVVNDREQTYFQSQWLSRSPAVLWMNGAILTDISNDKSIYRKVDRLFKKAEGATFAINNPVRTFLFGNEAYADSTSAEQKLQFLYTVNHYTGSAREILDSKDTSGSVEQDTNFFSQVMTSMFSKKDRYQCKDHMLSKFETDFGGKHIAVEQTGRTTFKVKGLLADATQTLQVDMRGRPVYSGEDAMKKKVSFKDKWKHVQHRVRTYFDTPCQGRSTAKNADVCKDAWTDYVEKHPEAKEKFDALVKAKGENANYGRDFTCKELYNPGKTLEFAMENYDYRRCREFFADRVPLQGLRFTKDSAVMKACEGTTCHALTDADFAKKSEGRFADSNRDVSAQAVNAARDAYRTALKNAGLDDKKLCPVEEEGDSKSCDHWEKNAKLKPADRAALEEAYKGVKNPNEFEASVAGGQKSDELATRMLGAMMLADCCEDTTKASDGSSCADRMSAKDVELKQTDKLQSGHQAH